VGTLFQKRCGNGIQIKIYWYQEIETTGSSIVTGIKEEKQGVNGGSTCGEVEV
jgi:hypothetical protein